MGLAENFDKASKDAIKLPESTSDEDKLILYGLFKQATTGDCNTSRPGLLDLKGKAKWDAWNALKGKTKEEAMEDYITKAIVTFHLVCLRVVNSIIWQGSEDSDPTVMANILKDALAPEPEVVGEHKVTINSSVVWSLSSVKELLSCFSLVNFQI
ncbi:hypothetical protein GOP47_0022613 [Adiantum capillus-veneris]|uniref:ACB domain-containing protein n=1 Tax=Adiantum capillus-veneris TaxID=13818 RepID=A0A9D4U5P5_ADICA|nr:hypothetical protein GOP47_0022613 [Adiantum capillus-veneris]